MLKNKVMSRVAASVLSVATIATIGFFKPGKEVNAATTTFLQQHVISIAKQEVGYKEKKSNNNLDDKYANAGSENWTKYARDVDGAHPNLYYGDSKNGCASWCDLFVDWCFVKAFGYNDGISIIGQDETDHRGGADCYNSYTYYGTHPTTPEPGDQIFFKRDGTFCVDHGHTGLVVEVKNGRVYTVEGNSSDEVRSKDYSLNDGSIYGYGRPNYGKLKNVEMFLPDRFTIREGQGYDIKGTVIFNAMPSKIVGQVFAKGNNNALITKTFTCNSPYTRSISVVEININTDIHFGVYNAGEYDLVITAYYTGMNNTSGSVNKHIPFTVLPSSRTYVRTLYSGCLDRGCSDNDRDWWNKEITSGRSTGARVAADFFLSSEFNSKNRNNDRDFVTRLYKTLLLRNPSNSEVDYWVSVTKSNGRYNVIRGFVCSGEYQNICKNKYGFNPGVL